MDVNKATQRELMTLKGVGKSLAARIVRARPFRHLSDLARVPGMTARLLEALERQDVTVVPPEPKKLELRIAGRVTEADDALVAFVFDDNGALIGRTAPRDRQRLGASEAVLGKAVTVAIGLESAAPESVTLERLLRRGFDVRRLSIALDRPVLDLGDWVLPPPVLRMSCCRVRGRVRRRITLPNGTTRHVPLCHARVQICEVERSPRRLIATLPADLLARLRLELIELGTPPQGPLPEIERQVVGTPVTRMATDRALARPFTETIAHAAGPLSGRSPQAFQTFQTYHPLQPLQLDTQRLRQLRAWQPTAGLETLALELRSSGIEAARRLVIDRIELLRPLWCVLEWLLFDFELECLRTVELDANGRFDTHIEYPCYADRPDLYLRVQQRCHHDGWTTVHAPSIPCNTHWNYCCGDEIDIVVTNPVSVPGRTPGGCTFPFTPGDPASVGEWTTLPDAEVFVVHAAVLHTGKVLLFSGGTEAQLPLESRVWDPVTGTVTAQSFADDLFCGHEVALADGRILVMGGSFYNGPHGAGIMASYTFDPLSESWTKHPDLNFGRWYPTAVLLSDGRALTLSGRDANRNVVAQVERFDPAANTWTTLGSSANKSLAIYPSLHLLKNGRVFYTGCRWAGNTRTWPSPPDTATFDPASGTWTDVGPHVITNRTEATSVLLPPARALSMAGHEHGEELPPPPSDQRVMVLGGEADTPANRASVEIIDMNDASPAWVRIADMHYRRVNPNAVILPDRRVLVVGGVEQYKFDWEPGAVLPCELFDPTTESWTTVAALHRPRQYHSVAVLLPDGRVLATGTTSRAGNDFSMEVYSPPYLFRGPRPRITGYPATAGYGATIEVDSPDACRVVDACLVRPAAPTHHTDSEQRLVPLHIHHVHHCSISLHVPDNPALLPPGYYMLFLLDDCEIPSEAKFVCIG